jgi:hypothetical protein
MKLIRFAWIMFMAAMGFLAVFFRNSLFQACQVPSDPILG